MSTLDRTAQAATATVELHTHSGEYGVGCLGCGERLRELDAANIEALADALRALVASLTYKDQPRALGEQGIEINAAIKQARAAIAALDAAPLATSAAAGEGGKG